MTGGGGILCSTMAKALAGCGAKVAILDLKQESAQKVADEIKAAGGAALGQREDALAVELGQAVDGLGEELRAGVGRVVPLLVDLRVV